MATRPTQNIPIGGAAGTYHAASGGGDKVNPAEGTLLHVKNGSGGSLTVTLVTPGTEEGLAIADRTAVIADGAEWFIPMRTLYRDPADGLASITWSGTTSVTFAVVRA